MYSKANKCIGDDTKAAAHQSPNCIKKTINKIRRKTIFNMADGILSPCNVVCSGIVTLKLWDRDIEFTKWQHPQCGTWLRDDMPLNSPGGSTLDTDIAVLSVHLCTHPSVIFPHIVLKRLKISSYFLQHTVAQSSPVYFFQY